MWRSSSPRLALLLVIQNSTPGPSGKRRGSPAGPRRDGEAPALASGWRRHKAVPAHDLRDLRQVRRASGMRRQHVVDLTEVVRPHDAGGGYRQELGIFGPVVAESVDRAASYAEGLARANVERPGVHRPSRDAFEPVNRLLEGVVTVRRRHLAIGRNEALEHADAPVRVGSLNHEAHPEGTHL